MVAVVQARMGSSRLPGKVLREVAGRPLLAWMLERVGLAASLDSVLVATTTQRRDDAVAAVAASAGAAVARGSEDDVLDRYLLACNQASAGTIVRLTADCPLLAPEVIDRVVEDFARGGADLVTNAPPAGRTFPDGMDVEVFGAEALRRAAAEATLAADREHVTSYFHHSPSFVVRTVDLEPPLGDVRITVDTAADLALVGDLLTRLGPRTPAFTLEEALAELGLQA